MAKQEIKPVYFFVHKVMSEPSLTKYMSELIFWHAVHLALFFFNARGFLINNYIILLLKIYSFHTIEPHSYQGLLYSLT